MLCAHTVRRLKPGTYEQFKEAFFPSADETPKGWVRFHALRGLGDENEVVTFGFFDGSLEELERGQSEEDFEERRKAIEPYVDQVIANGVYEIVETRELEGA
jgi:heme-degrading monooxygenase HmoA